MRPLDIRRAPLLGLLASVLMTMADSGAAALLTPYKGFQDVGVIPPTSVPALTGSTLAASNSFAAATSNAQIVQTFEGDSVDFVYGAGYQASFTLLQPTLPDPTPCGAGTQVACRVPHVWGSADLNSAVEFPHRPSSDATDGRYSMTPGTGVEPREGRWLEVTQDFEISFDPSHAIMAIAFLMTDVSDFDAEVDIELFDGQTSLGSSSIIGTRVNGNLGFFGITSDTPFDRVKFIVGTNNSTSGIDFLGFDQIQVAEELNVTNVPEPSTVLLAALAASGLALRRTLISSKRAARA